MQSHLTSRKFPRKRIEANELTDLRKGQVQTHLATFYSLGSPGDLLQEENWSRIVEFQIECTRDCREAKRKSVSGGSSSSSSKRSGGDVGNRSKNRGMATSRC